MSPENSASTDQQEEVPFPELETNDLTNAIVFELTPNGEFSQEQIARIKDLSESASHDIEGDRVWELKHIVFSFPDDTALFLCLDNADNCCHDDMWSDLRCQFGGGLKLKDAGEFIIFEGRLIIRRYVSKSLSNVITSEGCFACREKLSNMNIGLTIRKN